MCKRMLSILLTMKTCKISHKRQGGAEFFCAALSFMVFSWGVWASLPRYRSATPSGVKRRLLS